MVTMGLFCALQGLGTRSAHDHKGVGRNIPREGLYSIGKGSVE